MAHDFLLFGSRELAEIEAKLDAARSIWAEQWLGSRDGSVRCTPAECLPSETTEFWHAKPAKGLGIYIQALPGMSKRLTLALFGTLPKTSPLYETPTPLIGNCLSDALSDLASCTLQQLGDSDAAPRLLLVDQLPNDVQPAPGKGSLHAQLNFDEISLQMIIPGTLAKAVLRGKSLPASAAASTPLADPMPAVMKQLIPVTAILGRTQIDIGTLQSIQVGDVIRFQTMVDQPITLHTLEGATLCSGFVGSRDNFKSLQLRR